MPPRKSDALTPRFVVVDDEPGEAGDVSTASAGQAGEKREKEREKDKDRESGAKDVITIEDLTLPKSMITRLAKGVLPPNTQIQGNAILALCKSAVVFISYLANAANEHTLAANKKTITPQDVFSALNDTEFGQWRESLEAEFAKFNEMQTGKRTDYRRRVAAAKRAAGDGSTAGDSSILRSTTGDGDSTMLDASILTATDEDVPRAKKMKVDGAAAPEEEDDAETEPDEEVDDEDEDQEDEDDENDDEEEDGGDDEEDTQDGAEDRADREDDEALDDGDESD